MKTKYNWSYYFNNKSLKSLIKVRKLKRKKGRLRKNILYSQNTWLKNSIKNIVKCKIEETI